MSRTTTVVILCSLLVAGCTQQKDSTGAGEQAGEALLLESSSFTKEANDALLSYLPFADLTDFKNARKGFIATIPGGVIQDENGNISYSIKDFEFLKGETPNTANPSLWRRKK